MRGKIILMAMLVTFAFGCEKFENDLQDDIGPSSFSNDPALLKISYTEVAQWKATFAEGTPEGHPLTRSRWVNTPSDGLIKRSSQIGQQSSWRVGTEVREVRLDGVNHFEMGHSGVDRFFQDAFGGQYDDFFETRTRY